MSKLLSESNAQYTTAPFVWPPDYNAEKRRRLRLLLSAQEDRKTRIALMRYYATRPVDWINDFCFTFDPRVGLDPLTGKPLNKLLPFILFPKQKEFVLFLQDCLDNKQSGLVEKARDIGASWLCCAFAAWLFLFHPGSVIGFGSRKAEYVDKPDDPKAIFPKIRQILQNLPVWMMPEGFNWSVHSTHMKLVNPANLSAITGESGDNIGRGGRSSIFFKDESAHYENPESIEAALGDNTDVQIDISSVNGTANPFYKRRMAGKVWYEGHDIPKGTTRVFIFDWRDHPGKTQEWYDMRKAKAEREGMGHIFAQEVDRDYSGAIQGTLIPARWVKAAIDAHIKLEWRPGGEKVGMLDVADEGGDKNALVTREGWVCRYAQDWPEGDTSQTAETAVTTCQELGVYEWYYDSIGVGSGVKGETNRLRREGKLPNLMRIFPWSAAAKPLDADEHIIPDDEQSPTNGEIYENLKAQAYWRVRIRFEKTYKAVTFGTVYPHYELISLDSRMEKLHELVTQLSQPTKKKSEKTGKLMVNKKPDGATSPNLSDAFVGCYNPNKELSIFDVL